MKQFITPSPARGGPGRSLLRGEPAAHLREDAPPLPVPQLQVRGAVPLQDLQGAELLLLLGKGPEDTGKTRHVKKSVLIAVVMKPLPKGTHSYLAKTRSGSMYPIKP